MPSGADWERAVWEVCQDTSHYTLAQRIKARAHELAGDPPSVKTKQQQDDDDYTFDRYLGR